MITVSISEQTDSILQLIQKTLQSHHLRFSNNYLRTDIDVLFLSENQRLSCDVSLLHNGTKSPIHADYITLLNIDEQHGPICQNSIVVTYGLNPLATVTASSIQADAERTHLVCCIQRSIVTLKGKIIEPQEFPVEIDHPNIDAGILLGYITLSLILSISPTDFKNFHPFG